MNTPLSPIEVIRIQATPDHTERLKMLHEALRLLRWRKQEGDEHHAERIISEIQRLEADHRHSG